MGNTAGSTEDGLTSPSLVDASVGLGGYRERMIDSVTAAPEAIVASLLRHGVTAVHASSGTWEEYWTFQQIAEQGRRPALSGGGAALTDDPPASHRLRWVGTATEISRAVAVSETEGTGWVTVQSSSAEFVGAVADQAHRRGLRLALRGPGTCAQQLRRGDLFMGFINLLADSAADHPLDSLLAWQDETSAERAVQIARGLGEAGVGITTELLSHRRSVFVREGLRTPFLETLEPILPHTRHIREMSRPGGYLAGKQALRRNTGLMEPSRSTASQAQEGWARVLSSCEAVHREVQFLPGTRAPQITTVPGYSLKEELALLAHLGCSRDHVLAAATVRARAFLELPDAAPDELVADQPIGTDPSAFLLSLRPRGGDGAVSSVDA